LALRSFGVGSLNNIRWFMRWTRVLEAGEPTVPDARAWMHEFLNRRQVFVMEQRYGLTDPLFRPLMKRRTLQEIALMRKHVTRERIRQIEEESLEVFGSKLCRAVGDPLLRHWAYRIRRSGGAVTTAELADWFGEPTLGGYQPWGLLLMVSESTGAITFRHDYFTAAPASALDRIEAKILRQLQASRQPVPFAEVLAAASDELKPLLLDPERFLTTLLQKHPDIAGTVDRRYFLPAALGPELVAKILRQQARPVHFRELTRLYNELMLPHSRKGAGFILRAANLAPDVRRASRAYYEAKRG
jgi:hypothetical protein